MSIPFGLEEFENTVLGKLLLKNECRLNFLVDKLNRDIVFIIISEVMRKDSQSPLRFIFLNIPTWGFTSRVRSASKYGDLRNKPNSKQLQNGKDSLNERWQTPAPGTLKILSRPECSPGSNDVTDEPRGIIDGGESCAMLWMS